MQFGRHSPRKRIFYRILIPFSFLFAVATVLSWLVSMYLVTRFLDRNLDRQAYRVARVVSQSAFVLNPTMLSQLTNLINARIVVYDSKGRVLNTTFGEKETSEDAVEKVFASRITGSPYNRVVYGEVAYRVVTQQLGSEPDAIFVSIWTPLWEYSRLKKTIALGTGAVALAIVLSLIIVNWLVAGTITGPIEKLTRLTARVSEGDLDQRAEVRGGDEIAALADSFNQMIEKLLAYEKRLVESEKLAIAGQMAAGMAHEIRNPLTGIRMLAQLIQSRVKDREAVAGPAQSMVDEIDRLDRIIQEMVDRTRPKELAFGPGDLNTQVDEVLRFLTETFASRHIAVERDLAPDLPETVFDGGKIKQVLWNLLLNAKEAMPAGGLLRVFTRSPAPGFAEIVIEDTGAGVAAEYIEKLYIAFFTTKPEGMGMGLTISRKIVEQHGGSLSLENRPTGGVRARILLPVCPPGACRSEA